MDGTGKALPGHMKEATNVNRVETADRAEISTELEDVELCTQFWDVSNDLLL